MDAIQCQDCHGVAYIDAGPFEALPCRHCGGSGYEPCRSCGEPAERTHPGWRYCCESCATRGFRGTRDNPLPQSEAHDLAPWAAAIARAEGGWMAFEAIKDFEDWERQSPPQERQSPLQESHEDPEV